MRITRLPSAVAVGLVIVGVAACGGPAGDEDSSRSPENTAESDPFRVDEPKNLKAVASDPCALLTQEQVNQVGAGAPERGKSEWRQADCTWSNSRMKVTVAPDTVQQQGLRWMGKIAGDEQGDPTGRINGYPSLHHEVAKDSCETYVGTAEKDMLMVRFEVGQQNSDVPDPCSVADEVTEHALSNIPSA